MINLFLMSLCLMTVCATCAFGGLILGAWIYHRGMSAGSGQRETFTGRVPEGEVFRIPDAEDVPDEPNNENGFMDTKTMDRAERFLSTVMGGGR